jgi:hypothetical protein
VITGFFGEIPLRIQLEAILIRGFSQFDAKTTLEKVVFPIAVFLMDLSFIPYFFAKILTMFIKSYFMRTMLVRFCIHIYIFLRVSFYAIYTSYHYLVVLHNEIRDSRYLIGTQLTNRKINASKITANR